MYDVEARSMSPEFQAAWAAAGRHLAAQGDDRVCWLKSRPHPPFLEHLSFRLGNQLFFVQVDCGDFGPRGPGNPEGLHALAEGCAGHACRMPMRRSGKGWVPASPGWGLLSAGSGRIVDPPSLITGEIVEMTDWELHDFAVQVVRDSLEQDEGREVMSSCGDPRVKPSIWFVGDAGPEWVVVGAVRYPEREARPPANWAEIARGCAKLSSRGNFASVGVSASDGPGGLEFLARGHCMSVAYFGLDAMSPDGTLLVKEEDA